MSWTRDDIPDTDPDPSAEKSEVWITLDAKTTKSWKFKADSKDKTFTFSPSIKLIISKLRLVWDPEGSPEDKIGPRWNIHVFGEHKVLGGVKVMIGATVPRNTFIKGFACVREPGQIVSLFCESFDSGTFVNVWRFDPPSGEWSQMRGENLTGSDEEKTEGYLAVLRSHPLFDHSGSHLAPFAKGEVPKYGTAPTVSTTAPAGAPPPASAPPPGAREPGMTEKPVAGLIWFAWIVKRWHAEGAMEREVTENQKTKFAELANKHQLSNDQCSFLRYAFADLLGLPSGSRSFVLAAQVNDFLAEASETSIEIATKRGHVLQDAEFDPFADE